MKHLCWGPLWLFVTLLLNLSLLRSQKDNFLLGSRMKHSPQLGRNHHHHHGQLLGPIYLTGYQFSEEWKQISWEASEVCCWWVYSFCWGGELPGSDIPGLKWTKTRSLVKIKYLTIKNTHTWRIMFKNGMTLNAYHRAQLSKSREQTEPHCTRYTWDEATNLILPGRVYHPRESI